MSFYQVNSPGGGLRFGNVSEEPLAVDANSADGSSIANLRGCGTKNGATVDVKETLIGPYHYTEFTLTNTPLSVVSVTTGAGVGGYKIYDFPEGYINVLGTTSSLSISVATAKQADFTDNAPEGDIGIGTVLPANADALGTDATDDDLATAAAFTMAAWTDASVVNPPDSAGILLDGSSTAKDVNVNILVDASDIDDDTTSEILATGTIKMVWLNLGDI